MEPLMYVLAIMGCGDDGKTCVQTRIEQTQYSSLTACQRALPAGIARNTDLSFPTIAASCQAVGAQMAQGGAKAKARG